MKPVTAYNNPGTVKTTILNGKYIVTKYRAGDGGVAGWHAFSSIENARKYVRNLTEQHCYVLVSDDANVGAQS